MRSNDIRTVLDWATLSANDPLIGGSIASRVSQTRAHNDNVLTGAKDLPKGPAAVDVPPRREVIARYNDVRRTRILVLIIGTVSTVFATAALFLL